MKINKATKIIVTAYGVILALAGIEHGIGEILQGNTKPNSILIKSWGDSELFSILSGEPAMTIVPNFLVSGVLSILIATLIIMWVLFFLARNHSGLILVLLSLLLLLVGGGFGPPLVGIIIGLAGTKLKSKFPLLQKKRKTRLLKLISVVWYFSLPVGILCYLFLLPGSIILWGVFGFYNPSLIIITSILAFLMIFVSIVSAFSYDAINRMCDIAGSLEIKVVE